MRMFQRKAQWMIQNGHTTISYTPLKIEWYKCNLDLMSEGVKSRFHQLSPDEDTRAFIADSIEKSSWVWTQLWHSLAKSFLGFFMNRTDINGWLGRGSMFVLSSPQLLDLLQPCLPSRGGSGPPLGSLMDLGAGDGEVTLRWADLFSSLHATEMSATMRKLLETKGFNVLDADKWSSGSRFDVICLLNLLDRCSSPVSMLSQARAALEDQGVIIVALVLPFRPYDEYSKDHSPQEVLPISGHSFEEQVESFISFLQSQEMGLRVVSWSRVPYLCEGDISQSYYWLDDAIFVLKKDPQVFLQS